ncbi:hypothetical protein BER2_3484 [plant metagenome]|uniref:Phage protein n=1 Tax=plant metagenome TaxID=1297885 RepID=A0A484RAU8_9ZZZZ
MSLITAAGAATAPPYEAGQVWRYQTRPGEEQSRVLINKVERHDTLGWIFHISVLAVQVKNPCSDGGISTALPHFPVSAQTLKDSLLEVEGSQAPNPDYLEGYEIWKAAFDKGEAGVFTLTVADIVGVVEQTINQ